MSATITYTLSQKENVILVPNAALNMRDGAPTVTMADGSERTIEIGESDMYHTEVLSGLQEGDSILSITIFAQDINSAGIMDENAERMMQMASE